MIFTRRDARICVVQAFYEADFLVRYDEKNIQKILERLFDEEVGNTEPYKEFALFLIHGVVVHLKDIDTIISRLAPEWPVEKINYIDKNILRLGVFELLFGKTYDTPKKVAINEALELARAFSDEKTTRFINGVLGALYKEIGDPESSIPVKRVKKSVGGLTFFYDKGIIVYALVHDIFGKWTLSKDKVLPEEKLENAIVRVMQQELGLTVTVEEEIGYNVYIAHPPEGSVKKEVTYFLVRTHNNEIDMKPNEGLREVRWLTREEIERLPVYKDMRALLVDGMDKAEEIIQGESARVV
ncbi:MAG: transcription antitermination factor NusB [Alphaproteobacteria bacterium]|nr:transcription antitermination factor NusB [Alphaproteobacteria bacterium]